MSAEVYTPADTLSEGRKRIMDKIMRKFIRTMHGRIILVVIVIALVLIVLIAMKPKNHFESGRWSNNYRVFTNGWSNIKINVPDKFKHMASDENFVKYRDMTMSEYTKRFDWVLMDMWIQSIDLDGKLIDVEILYINRNKDWDLKNIKDNEQVLKSDIQNALAGGGLNLEYYEETIAGEQYLAATVRSSGAIKMYTNNTDSYDSIYTRLYDDTIIQIRIIYSEARKDEAMALLHSIEPAKKEVQNAD